jgi:hypothetical protein
MNRSKPLILFVILLVSSFQLVLKAQDPFVRHVPDTVVSGFKTGKGYEYANDPAYWKKPAKPKEDSWNIYDKVFNPALWQLIGYAFLGAIFIFVLYRLIANAIYYRKGKRTEQFIDLSDDVMKLDEGSLKSLLKELLAEGKYREAIRTHYLLTLLSLERSGLIKFDSNATNHDYAHQLKDHRAYTAFSFLTRIYEYAWYGDMTLSQQDYTFAEKRFADFKQLF